MDRSTPVLDSMSRQDALRWQHLALVTRLVPAAKAVSAELAYAFQVCPETHELARQFGVSGRVMQRRFERLGIPTIRNWIYLSKVLRLLHFVRAKQSIAGGWRVAGGWEDEFSASNSMKVFFGLRPLQLSRLSDEEVVKMWLEVCAARQRGGTRAVA